MFKSPDTTDCAVMMVCDSNYLPFALHLGWQMAMHCPNRGFDILIVTPDDLALPAWAEDFGIRQVTVPLDPAWAPVSGGRYPPITFLPFHVVGTLAGRYRRILALDSDVWFEGADLDRFLNIGLGPHAVAGVLDAFYINDGLDIVASEFKARGLPAWPYLNSGVLLYDTAAYLAQDFGRRFLETGLAEGKTVRYADQSILNLVLKGQFAELAPAWNWQGDYRLRLTGFRYPARFRHFIGPWKPWLDGSGKLDARFGHGYSEFFRIFLPEALARIQPWHNEPLGFRDTGRVAFDHLKARDRLTKTLERFPDDWTVRH